MFNIECCNSDVLMVIPLQCFDVFNLAAAAALTAVKYVLGVLMTVALLWYQPTSSFGAGPVLVPGAIE